MINIDNLTKIKAEVAESGQKITVVAASKTQSSETLDELMQLAPDFVLGENRVQELLSKYNPKYCWHLIGQLQTNKVKYIIDKVELIHSLDRIELAKEIEKQANKVGKVQDCLIEINMGAEISKGGIATTELSSFLSELASFDHIRICGLMAVLPNLGDTPELNQLFSNLRDLFLKMKEIRQDNVDVKYLSAGMSNDYNIAIKYGANMIRLGRTLFGDRN